MPGVPWRLRRLRWMGLGRLLYLLGGLRDLVLNGSGAIGTTL
jgi:hypothetical protein